MDTVLIPTSLVDGTGQAARTDVGVAIADGQIVEVGPAADLSSRDGVSIEVLDGTLIPGLIDAHVHLAWGLDHQPRWPAHSGSAEARLAWALSSGQAALAAGVTTVRDCGAAGLEVVRLRDAIRAGLVVGPNVLACGPAITTTAGHGEFVGVTADTVDEVRLRVRELCNGGVDFIKVMASGGDMDPHTNRLRAQYSDEQMKALVEDAHRLQLPVVSHCNPTEAIAQAVATGVDTIAHCNWLGAVDGTIDYLPDVAEALVDAGCFIDLNVDGTLNPYAGGDGRAQEWDRADPPTNRWELLAEIRAAGGRVFLSSDEFGGGLANFPALLARVVSETDADTVEVVHRATAVPAAAIGQEDERGTIAAGKVADLVLLDGDPVSDPSALTRARTVWQRGTRVVDEGRIALGGADR